MTEPLVVCVMLTADRQKLATSAVACFEQQDYQNKKLLVLDTGQNRFTLSSAPGIRHPDVSIIHAARQPGETLGCLRNYLNANAQGDMLAHFDDDDWRGPHSISEMVAALVANEGAVGCGYSDCLFAEQIERASITSKTVAGELEQGVVERVTAWRTYRWKSNLPGTYVLGGSLMYWRRTWEVLPFPALHNKEDYFWMKALQSVGKRFVQMPSIPEHDSSPRMIVRRHASNTNTMALDMEHQCEHAPTAWRRSHEWDEKVKEILG